MINVTGLTITRRDTESHQSKAHASDDHLERIADISTAFHRLLILKNYNIVLGNQGNDFHFSGNLKVTGSVYHTGTIFPF
jgi:hypothetical protein